MKIQQVMMIAAAMVLGTEAKKQRTTDTPECVCESVCLLKGDPHLTTFFNEQARLGHTKDLTLYASEGFTVVAELFQDWFVGKIQFGSKTFEATSCTKKGEKFHAEQALKSGDSVLLELTCSYPKSSKYEKQLHFDVQLTKRDSGGAADFRSMEKKEGSKGACLTVPQQAVNGQKTTIKCNCKATCRAYGDPHLEDFDGKQKLILDSGDLLLYTEGNFHVVANVQDTRMRTISFGSKTFTASADVCKKETCHTCNNKFHAENKSSNGDTLSAEITCRYLPETGYFFDIVLSKDDITLDNGKTFDEIESHLGTGGACRGQSALQRYRGGSLRA